MCGIAGFISKDKEASIKGREILLGEMCRVITHRGPDEEGTLVAGRAALGMRRLSIIDLKSGQQPIYNEDGNLAIVFNGEIYNFQELKKDLESRGHRFKTNSDTETIVHAYEEFGEYCVDTLRGMFGFAIWDKREEKLFLARDCAGKKPLFYTITEQGDFVFGSELKVLLKHGAVEKKINLAALDAYLAFGYVPEDFCIFENVQKLPPGHFLIFQNGAVKIEKYWDFPLADEKDRRSEADICAELREILFEAVKIRLISEVPLGAFLSGGVDSSAVVGAMARFSKVKTFSIGFNEDSYNELKYARVTAKHFDTEHHEFVVTPEIVNEVDRLVWHFDEPFADSSALPTFVVSKMAREFVTVVLSGDGGDELFGGYTRYANHLQRNAFERLPKAVRQTVFGKTSELLPRGARGRNFLRNVSLGASERYVDSVSHFTALNRQSLYAPDFRRRLNGSFAAGERSFLALTENFAENSLDSLLYLDSKTYLPADILTKVDRMSMAVSLEARAPLLDYKLIEFAARLPAELKIKNLETKYIFKKAVREFVPHEILDRPKQGFGVPINVWINQQLRGRIHETLLEKRTLERGFFAAKYLETLLDEHERGRRDHAWKLWALFMLELWLRQYIDAN
jgi:asparagine synthase (glutamine-hydrolysing)